MLENLENCEISFARITESNYVYDSDYDIDRLDGFHIIHSYQARHCPNRSVGLKLYYNPADPISHMIGRFDAEIVNGRNVLLYVYVGYCSHYAYSFDNPEFYYSDPNILGFRPAFERYLSDRGFVLTRAPLFDGDRCEWRYGALDASDNLPWSRLLVPSSAAQEDVLEVLESA